MEFLWYEKCWWNVKNIILQIEEDYFMWKSR